MHKLLKGVRLEMKKKRAGLETYLKRELAEVFRFASGFIAPTTARDVSPTDTTPPAARNKERRLHSQTTFNSGHSARLSKLYGHEQRVSLYNLVASSNTLCIK